jgi:hypothetical protein
VIVRGSTIVTKKLVFDVPNGFIGVYIESSNNDG